MQSTLSNMIIMLYSFGFLIVSNIIKSDINNIKYNRIYYFVQYIDTRANT